MTNILALPMTQLAIQTSNNEDWVDSIMFMVGTDDPAATPTDQLDLRGITFDMEVRRTLGDAEIILAASTDTGTLQIGLPPDFGFLIINIPIVDMQSLSAGVYVGDITGRDGIYTRVAVQFTLTIVQGATIQPVNERIVVEAP
jgi:hypothetical protein